MKEPLPVVLEDLRSTLDVQFGITISSLEFVPIGENSWLYKATDTDNRFLAVKVQREDNPAVDEVRQRLALSGYTYVPEIHLTKSGKTQADIDGLYVSVEQYIEHSDVKVHDSTPGKEYLVTLGKALRSLHEVEIPAKGGEGPIPVESFQSSYLAPAQETLAAFMDWSTGKPQAQTIKDLLTEKSESIQALFDRSVDLGAKLKMDPPRPVLTHGDVHFGNTIETDDGRFYLIDWDTAMIGGAGHDLMYFSDAQLADISLGYGSDLLADQNDLQYYRTHLMLRFVWFWLDKAMSAADDKSFRSATETISTTLKDSDYMQRALGN